MRASGHPHPARPTLGRARAVTRAQIVHIEDVRADPDYIRSAVRRTRRVAGIRTLLAVPMLKEDELIGAIVIYREEVRPFTDKQIELVHELRRPGRHRHREHAAAQRAAATRSAAAADRDRRRAQGDQPLDVRSAGRARHAGRSRRRGCARPTWRSSRVQTGRQFYQRCQPTASRPSSTQLMRERIRSSRARHDRRTDGARRQRPFTSPTC